MYATNINNRIAWRTVMNKLVHGIDRDFTVAPNQIFRDRRLSFKAKGLWLTIISLPDGWNFSISGMAQLSTEKESAIKRAMLELVEYKYLKWDKITDGLGRFSVVVTTMLPVILPDGEKPQGKKPQGKTTDNKELRDKELTNKIKTNTPAVSTASVPDKPVTGVKTLKQAFEELVAELGYTGRTEATRGRLEKLRIRIRSMGYQKVLAAAKNVRADPYMQGDNKESKRYGTIDYLLRNDETVDRWANNQHQTATGPTSERIQLTAEEARKYYVGTK